MKAAAVVMETNHKQLISEKKEIKYFAMADAIMCDHRDDMCTRGPYGNGNPNRKRKQQRNWKTTWKQEARFWM